MGCAATTVPHGAAQWASQQGLQYLATPLSWGPSYHKITIIIKEGHAAQVTIRHLGTGMSFKYI